MIASAYQSGGAGVNRCVNAVLVKFEKCRSSFAKTGHFGQLTPLGSAKTLYISLARPMACGWLLESPE